MPVVIPLVAVAATIAYSEYSSNRAQDAQEDATNAGITYAGNQEKQRLVDYNDAMNDYTNSYNTWQSRRQALLGERYGRGDIRLATMEPWSRLPQATEKNPNPDSVWGSEQAQADLRAKWGVPVNYWDPNAGYDRPSDQSLRSFLEQANMPPPNPYVPTPQGGYRG